MSEYVSKPAAQSSFVPPAVQIQTRPFAPSQVQQSAAPQNAESSQAERDLESQEKQSSQKNLYYTDLSFSGNDNRGSTESVMQRKWQGIVQRSKEGGNAEPMPNHEYALVRGSSQNIMQRKLDEMRQRVMEGGNAASDPNYGYTPVRGSSQRIMQRKHQEMVQRYKENQAKTIQAKLAIGAVGDRYEQEADRVASEVVQKINAPESVQREEAPEEEEKLQMKPAISSIQRDPEEEEEIQMKPFSEAIQREGMPEEEEELQAKSLVQRRDTLAGGEASADLESSIQSARGSGQSLDPNLQAKMGEAMGADFSGVKVHTDAKSDQLNKSIQAKAFTTDQDVFFRQGAYDPSSREGQELIAHELTHVVQQNGAAIQSQSMVNRSLIQTNRGRSNATTEAPDLDAILPVAKLHMHADLDAPGMNLLKQLNSGSVGHTWVELEWKDPTNIPDDLPDAHKNQLKTGGDPFGFWPNKFEWKDYGGLSEAEIFKQLLIDNKETYDETFADLLERYPDAPREEIIQYMRDEVIQSDVDIALTWGGIQLRAADAVGYSPNPFKSYVAGQVLHPDYMHNAKATQSYDLTRKEVDSVLQYAESKKNAQYSVFFYNCTTFAKEAVESAGKPAPSAGIGNVCIPDSLYKSIEKNFNKGRGETSLLVGDIMQKRIGPELGGGKKKKGK
ncbi:DUF4157 domain-containing protein [Tumidithrix elongata RA019]|uniref:DUF4157 domain-containing protein n=1 Tax=Tumidithrix elongata BACA0141 TaxID=2716417 RepID=A0AAW9PWU1_9CYAN|nr:DUF4157 domain-containing protein [Tumidithrix elongata RA019]